MTNVNQDIVNENHVEDHNLHDHDVLSLDDKMTVSQLIKKANGLKPDALIANAYIKRTNSDFSTINISFNLDKLIKGEIEDIILNKEDVLTIISKNDLINDQINVLK